MKGQIKRYISTFLSLVMILCMFMGYLPPINVLAANTNYDNKNGYITINVHSGTGVSSYQLNLSIGEDKGNYYNVKTSLNLKSGADLLIFYIL